MDFKKDFKLLEKSSVSLKIVVEPEQVKKEFSSLVDEYSQKIAIKGFRPGKVPADVIIRKFGEGLRAETAEKIIKQTLDLAMQDSVYPLLPYAMPELQGDKIELKLDSAFEFEVKYDTFPKIGLTTYKDFIVKEPVVKISKEDIDTELKSLQEQNALVKDKEDGTVTKENTVTIDYAEVDEQDKEIAGTQRAGFTFTVGSGYNLHKIDDDILGMRKDEEKVLEKEYPPDFEDNNLAGRKIKLKVRIVSVKEKLLPQINDELAQDISEKYQTLDELKKDIEERLTKQVNNIIRNRNIEAILGQIAEQAQLPIPEAMIQYNLELRFREFTRQFGGNDKLIQMMLERQNKSLEDLFAEWRPGVEKEVGFGLIIEKISCEEKIEVLDEEVDEEIKKAAEKQDKEFSELKNEYQTGRYYESLRHQLKTEQVYNKLLEYNQVKKGERTKYLDLLKVNS